MRSWILTLSPNLAHLLNAALTLDILNTLKRAQPRHSSGPHQAQYVDYAAYVRSGGNETVGRAAASVAMRRMAAQGNPCIVGHRPRCLLQKCDALYSFLCLERENPRPCEQYQGRPGAWLVPQGCPGDASLCVSEKIYGNAALCAGKYPKKCPLLDSPKLLP